MRLLATLPAIAALEPLSGCGPVQPLGALIDAEPQLEAARALCAPAGAAAAAAQFREAP